MNATGHMVVAKIAWDVMTPAARAAVTTLVKDPHNPVSGTSTSAQDSDTYTAACYMDDIRPTLGGLHFDDAYIDKNGKPVNKPGVTPNSVTFCADNMAILTNPKSSTDQKAEALRYVMHLSGDLHQPLHCVSQITTQNPDGDHGGNLFPIQWNNTDFHECACGHDHEAGVLDNNQQQGHGANLHSYWDSAAGEFPFMPRPLDSSNQSVLTNLVSKIEKQYPMSSFASSRVQDFNPKDWHDEGVALGSKDVYSGISPNQAPSQAYEQKVVSDMNSEAALAGYRLGNFLNSVFK
jgi:S1/P1 Nuclease